MTIILQKNNYTSIIMFVFYKIKYYGIIRLYEDTGAYQA